MIKINEIFYSIQGEGSRTGQPTIFVRFAGCNLNCDFCDTAFETGDKMSVEDVVAACNMLAKNTPHVPWVTLTGGEPVASPEFTDLVRALRREPYHVSVETNGTYWSPGLLSCNLVTISPKMKWEGEKAALHENLYKLSGSALTDVEVKIIVDTDDDLVSINTLVQSLQFHPKHVYLQPIFEERDAWRVAVEICMQWPAYRLSLQMQNWAGLR